LNLNQLQELFSGQGLVFWLAVTAVAIGLTLLSVSIVYQVRKILGTIRLPKLKRVAAPKDAGVSSQPHLQITETETGYQAQAYVTPQVDPTAESASVDPVLTGLLSRLRTSAERLENMHKSLDQTPFAFSQNFESTLKVSSEDVDYLYKSERS